MKPKKDAGPTVAGMLAGWVWRQRLNLAAPAVAVTVAGRWAAADGRLTAGARWHATSRLAEIGDRWAAPAGSPPAGWWYPAAMTVVGVGVVTVAWLVVVRAGWPAGSRFGRWTAAERRWRAARLVEARWERAMWDLGLTSRGGRRSRVPRLVDVKVTLWGGFTGRVLIPRGFKVGALLDEGTDGLVRREMDMGGRLGACEQIVWHTPTVDAAKRRQVDLVFAGLPDPSTLPKDVRPAESDSVLRIGVTRTGWVGWDLDQQPFLRLSGRSGSGKGVWCRWVICQAVRKGWLVCIICGAGAPEHRRWAALPNVLYHPLQIDGPGEALAEFDRQLALIQRLAAHRRRLCLEYGADDWKGLPARVRRQNPRLLVVFDEFTGLVGKAPEEQELRVLREQIGFRINRMFRLYRKYGVNGVVGDQITYSTTWVGSDGLAQATQFVFAGRANPTQQRMVSPGTVFPTLPGAPGYGAAGVVGEPEAEAVCWPPLTGSDVDGVVAEELALWPSSMSRV